MVGAYWKRVGGRAAREAAKFLHLDSPWRVMTAALALLGAAVISFFGPSEGWLQLVRFVTVLALVAYPIVFFWKLVRIPPRLETEGALAADTLLNKTTSAFQTRLSAAELRTRDLERHLEPKLQIIGVSRHDMRGSGPGKYYYDVEIRNGGCETFDNCLVKVEGANVTDGSEGAFTDSMQPTKWPLVLRTQSQYEGDRSGSFNLRPGEQKPLKLVRNAHSEGAIVIEHENGEAVLRGVRRCSLHLTAYGPPAPTRATVEVSLDEDGLTAELVA